MTAYAFASVPKKDTNAGRPKGKKQFIILFKWADIETYTRDERGVRVTALTFKTGKKPVGIYATSSTIKINHTSEGDDDARGFIHHAEFEHPGSSVEFDECVNNNINEELGAIVLDCISADAKIAGEPSTPLKLTKADSDDSKDADKNVINLASTLRGNTIGYIAKSLLTATDNVDVNAALGLTVGSAGTGI